MRPSHSKKEMEFVKKLCVYDTPIKQGSSLLATRVQYIAGQEIHPDIDILKIEQNRNENRAVGYEVKWIKRYKNGGIS